MTVASTTEAADLPLAAVSLLADSTDPFGPTAIDPFLMYLVARRSAKDIYSSATTRRQRPKSILLRAFIRAVFAWSFIRWCTVDCFTQQNRVTLNVLWHRGQQTADVVDSQRFGLATSSVHKRDQDVYPPQPQPLDEMDESDNDVGIRESIPPFALGSSSSDIEDQESQYDWDISLKSFNMDLYNLAMEDPVKAHDAVEVMLELYLKDPVSTRTLQPDATCFTTVMDGYILAGKLEQAQEVLDQMENLASADVSINGTTKSSSFAPTDFTYILMIQAWANDFREDFSGTSAENAVSVFRRIQKESIKRKSMDKAEPEPSATSRQEGESTATSTSGLVKAWTIIVDGWCKRSGIARQAMQRAEELLIEMEKQDAHSERPNVLTYTSFIAGLARCRRNDLARKAEEVLERMEQNGVEPDMVAYTSVINCWAKAVSRFERSMAATRALSILGDMERMYIMNKMYNIKPSVITYATAIAAIGNSLNPEAPQLAEEVLKRMQRLHESGAIANLKPGTSIYNAVIYALSRAPVANRLRYAQRAEQILDEMTQRAQKGENDVQADVRTWASVLRAWTRSKQPDAAENAQRVLDKMEYRYKKGMSTVRPNFVCCTTVMGAWGQSSADDALEKMERILRRMEENYEESLEPDIRPNTVSYVTVSVVY